MSADVKLGLVGSVIGALGCTSGFELYRAIYNGKDILALIVVVALSGLILCSTIFLSNIVNKYKQVTEKAIYFVSATMITEIALTVFSFL